MEKDGSEGCKRAKVLEKGCYVRNFNKVKETKGVIAIRVPRAGEDRRSGTAFMTITIKRIRRGPWSLVFGVAAPWLTIVLRHQYARQVSWHCPAHRHGDGVALGRRAEVRSIRQGVVLWMGGYDLGVF